MSSLSHVELDIIHKKKLALNLRRVSLLLSRFLFSVKSSNIGVDTQYTLKRGLKRIMQFAERNEADFAELIDETLLCSQDDVERMLDEEEVEKEGEEEEYSFAKRDFSPYFSASDFRRLETITPPQRANSASPFSSRNDELARSCDSPPRIIRKCTLGNLKHLLESATTDAEEK